jgi:hypothetical protein
MHVSTTRSIKTPTKPLCPFPLHCKTRPLKGEAKKSVDVVGKLFGSFNELSHPHNKNRSTNSRRKRKQMCWWTASPSAIPVQMPWYKLGASFLSRLYVFMSHVPKVIRSHDSKNYLWKIKLLVSARHVDSINNEEHFSRFLSFRF